MILASNLSELEQFERRPRNCLFSNKIEFLANGIILGQNSRKLTPLKIQFYYLDNIAPPTNTFFIAWQLHQFDFGVIIAAF